MEGRELLVSILMERDGFTKEEAESEVEYAAQEVGIAISEGFYDEAEELIMDILGLEPDYLLDLLELFY